VLLIARPRWHRLVLWSSALREDQLIMRSNQPGDLEWTARLMNDAIRKALGSGA
jgi:hypothetical protein